MPVLINNNAASRLASSLTSSATTLSVTPGEGARFPTPGAGQWFPVTLIKASGVMEIMRCTGRSSDVLTVVRAQEGTAATTFSAGDRVELRVTAAAFAEFVQDDEFSAFFKTLFDDENAEAMRTSLGLGNAATATVQSSANDTTPGRLLSVGAGGILGNAVSQTGLDFNSVVATGFYYSSGSVNSPFPGVTFTLLHINSNSTRAIQIAYQVNNGSSWVRAKDTTWSSWVNIATTDASGSYKLGVVQAASVALTAADTGKYYFTSTNGLTITLPNPNTLTLGQKFIVAVGSTTTGVSVAAAAGTISSVNNSGSGSSFSIEPGAMYEFVAITTGAYHALKISGLPLGEKQTWQDLTASRALSTSYTNTTGRPICVAVTSTLYTNGRATLNAIVSGLTVQTADSWSVSGGRANLSFIVPPGAVYSVSGAALLGIWSELR